jgi:uncharacterized protein (TIGR00369 family)
MVHKITRKQPNSKMCFVCGLKNSAGLNASFFETDDGGLVATFTPRAVHQSYPGRMHGGIASTILDETIGRAIMVGSDKEVWGVTLELTVEYKKPIPLESELRAVARITEENGRFFSGKGEILLPDGVVAATASGRYMKVPIEKIAEFEESEFEWGVVPRSIDPVSIELLKEKAGEKPPP